MQDKALYPVGEALFLHPSDELGRLLVMDTATPLKASKSSPAFRMQCAVRATISATPKRIWALLVDPAAHAQWNSTVNRIEGAIVVGNKLKLTVPYAKERVFTPKVIALVPQRTMVWSDGFAPMFKGVRTFELSANTDGSTDFSMTETFSGLILPMIKGSLADFVPVFEAYAADLKRAAESAP